MTTKTKTKTKTAKKNARKPRRLFEGKQAVLPGHKPRKPGAATTYTAPSVDGAVRTVEVPAVEATEKYAVRRRPMSAQGAPKYTARMELRTMPAQLAAYGNLARKARLSTGEWIRSVCDAAVAAGAEAAK